MNFSKSTTVTLSAIILAAGAMLTCEKMVMAAPVVWSSPAKILANTRMANQNGDNLGSQLVKINNQGQAVAAWVRGNAIQAQTRDNGIWGSTTTLVPGLAGQSVKLLDLAQSPLGEAVAIFLVTPPPPLAASVQTSFYRAGIWSAPAPIPATAGALVLNARIQYDGQTVLPATPTATLVWSEKAVTPLATTCAVLSATGNAQSGWRAAGTISSTDQNCYSFIDLAVNQQGVAALALGHPGAGRHGGSPAVVTSRNKAGVWATLTDLGSGFLGSYRTQPFVAIPDNGAAIAVFSDADLGVQWSRRSPTDGSWSAVAVLDGSVPAVPTKIAMAANGKATVVYNAYYTVISPAPLLASTLKAGSAKWQAPVEITDPSGDIDSFQVAATPSGSFVVGWVDSLPTMPIGVMGASMGVSTLSAGDTNWVTTTLDADMVGTFSIPSPTAVSAAPGRAIVVWDNNYISKNGLYGSSQLKTSKASIK